MHPALSLQSLSHLPISIRRFATAAAAGSEADLIRVAAHIVKAPEQSARLLPVIFAILDPALIPDPDLLDTASPATSTVSRLSLAYRALAVWGLICPTSDVYPHIWPRVWRWAQILELHHHFLPDTESVEELGCRFLAAFYGMLHHDETAKLIHATPGVHAFFGRLWTAMDGTYDPKRMQVPLTALYYFMRPSDWNSANIDELIEGSGGSAVDLAVLIVRQIYLTIGSERTPLSRMELSCLSGILALVRYGDCSQLLQPLLSEGIVGAVTQALFPLAVTILLGVDETLDTCLGFVAATICASPGYPYLPDALDVGLLDAITLLGGKDFQTIDLPSHLQRFLGDILPGAMVYHTVACAMRSNAPSVHEGRDARFVNAEVRADWLALLDLVQERVDVLHYYESSDYVCTKACDGPQVHSADVLMCSAALSSLSERSDAVPAVASIITARSNVKLPDGEMVAIVNSASLCDPPHPACSYLYPAQPAKLTKREEAFLRLTLNRDYQANKLDVLLKQLTVIHRTRSPKIGTVFDYFKGRCTIYVGALGQKPGCELPPQLAGQSSMELHKFAFDGGGIHGGADNERRVFRNYLLRSTSGALTDGLVRIAAALPDGADVSQLEREHPAIFEEVKMLSDLEVGETYGDILFI
ncbi:hypothetical protein DFH09DRAFT_1275611 [Mycena vulgaris]|nr:hypothetical protein DFH09DRAFT_1275611 [Mycena vulgaris]